MNKPTTTPIPDTPFQRRMAQGHLNRHGHKLTGYMRLEYDAANPDAFPISHLVRTCCEES